MAAGDRAAVGIEARVVGGHADAVAPGQHLHRERLVQLEEADVVDREALALEELLVAGTGPRPIRCGSTPA